MRTLKKTLCLVLCLAMMVGLCAVGASAKFDDADKIQNTEAVDLLTGLGVITGMGDGTFNPTGTLTRAQAAAIITRLLGLGELAKATTVFSDVPADYWASGYIALCSSQGIIAGLGDGTFNPEGKLKGYEWAKMLLCALGYDAKQEGLVGTDFEINVERLVKKTLLADGIKFIGSAEINRDDACQLGFNALTVPMVEYNGGTQVSTSDGTQVTVNANIGAANSYLADNFKLDVMAAPGGTWQSKDVFDDGTFGTPAYVEGVIIENSANNDVKTTTLQDGTVYVIDTDASLLGHYVKIYREKTPNADASIPAISIVDESKVVTVSTAIAAGDAAAFKKAFGVAAAQVTVRGTASDAIFPANPGAVADGDTNCDPTLAAATPVGTYILDPTNTVVAEINPAYSVVTLNKVSTIVTKADNEVIKFNADTLTINNGKKNGAGVAQDFIREYDGIAKDDYVLLTRMGNIYTAAKCETVEGKISAVAANNAITLDGTAYKASTAVDNSGLTAVAPGTITAANMKTNTYTLYLDGDGKYVTCVVKTGEAAVSDLMYVVATYHKSETTTYGDKTMYYAQVIDMNGKEDKVLIGVDPTTGNYVNGEGRNALAAGFYTFAAKGTDAAGKALGIKDATALAQNAVIAQPGDLSWSVLTANTSLKTTTANVTLATAGKAYLNADTVYLFVQGATNTLKVEKKTGGVNMDLTAANAKFVFTEDADGNRITKAVIVTAAYDDTGVDSSTMIYTPANAAKKSTTTTGFTYNVYNAATGEAITITADDDGGIAAGFHKFSVANGVYKVAAAEAASASIKLNEVYASKYGTKITSTNITDLDVSGAVIVDTRDPDDWGDEGELNTLAAIDAANKANGGAKNVTFDAIVNAAKGTVSIIFVKAYA